MTKATSSPPRIKSHYNIQGDRAVARRQREGSRWGAQLLRFWGRSGRFGPALLSLLTLPSVALMPLVVPVVVAIVDAHWFSLRGGASPVTD